MKQLCKTERAGKGATIRLVHSIPDARGFPVILAHQYDVPIKSALLRPGNGLLRKLLWGGGDVEFLPTEQPKFTNRRVDLLVRNEKGKIWHIEFQASNDPNFGFRMLEYWVYLEREYDSAQQVMVYLGREKLRMEPIFRKNLTTHGFHIIDLRELDAKPLLESDDWADNLMAIVASGDLDHALDVLLTKVRAMDVNQRGNALAELLSLSGILKLEETLKKKFEEVVMQVDWRENAIIGPLLEEAEQRGELLGQLAEQKRFLQMVLTEKFGPSLPSWISGRLSGASTDELNRWAVRSVRCSTLEETFR